MSECAICQGDVNDNVFMSCSNKHGFCFKCIVESVEKTRSLMNCPLCRGGNKIIILEQNAIERESDDFYSLYNFKKSLSFVSSVLEGELKENVNSCIVSEKELVFYVKNKEQLIMAQYLKSKFEFANIVKYIKWNKDGYNDSSVANDFVEFLSGIAGETYGGRQFSGSGNPFPGAAYTYSFTPYGMSPGRYQNH